jgi:hypothetical protein
MTDKIVRVPHEWDEPCRECNGSGHVHKVERLHLWTPDEYAKLMGHEPTSLDPKFDVPSNAYVCHAMGGATIFEACREGIGLAKRVGLPVVFEFNNALAICHADSDAEDVAKRWWLKAYGKTYEQSMRER